MLDRLNFFAVLNGHWKGLSNRQGSSKPVPDLLTRWLLVGASGAAAAISYLTGLELKSPGNLFSGLSLLTGALLAAFAQIAGIRARFPVPQDPEFDDEIDTRNMLDESVAHVLTAALLSGAMAFIIVVGVNVSSHGETCLNTPFSTVVAGMGTYLAILFLMTVRKLYAAYVVGNEVSDHLSGHVRN